MDAIEKQAELQLAPCFKMTTKGLQITGNPTYSEWEAVGETLKFLESSIQFAIGDWLRYGEKRWGEKYAQAAEETGYSEKSLREYVWVANAVDMSIRMDNLPFAHHQLVAPMKTKNGAPDVEKQRHYLELAEKQELPVSKLRKVIKEDKRAVEEQRRIEAGQTPMPSGKYRCIVIDPPYPMQKIERDERPNQGTYLDYPTMAEEDICNLPVGDLADETGCHLYAWTTQKFLPFTLELIQAWGFRYQCVMTWVKPTGMTPYSWMYNTELVVFARIGSLPLLRNGLKLSFDAPSVGHSVKPDVFFERVLQASPEPRLEMFSRRVRDGFTAWGSEIHE